MSLLSRIPLLPILAFSATLELLLNRIGVHLARSPEERSTALFHLIDLGGLFTFYLTGFLGLAIFCWAVLVLVRDHNLLRVPDRLAFTVLAALFIPLACWGMFLSLPKAVNPHLNTSFGLLTVALMVSFARQPATLRAKLGIFYLTVPLLLHAYWLMTQQIPSLAPTGEYSEVPSRLFVAAEHMAVVGAFAAFLFFAPFPRIRNLLEPVPVVFAAVLTGAVAFLAKYQYLDAAQAAYYGLGLNLPPPSGHGLMYLAALFVFVLTIGALIMRGRNERAIAVGLYLIAVSGFHLQLPYQFVLTLVGLLQVIRGSVERSASQVQQQEKRTPFPDTDSWKAYLSRLAALCSEPSEAGEAVLLHNSGQQIAHVRGKRDSLPFTLRILQKGGAIRRFEAMVGQPPKDPAPLSVNRRRGCRGERVSQKAAGAKVKLELETLDQQFTVHDGTGRASDILTRGEVASQLERLIHGWLGLWPGEGIHYIARPAPDGWPVPVAEVSFSPEDATTEEIEELVDLLCALARDANVSG